MRTPRGGAAEGIAWTAAGGHGKEASVGFFGEYRATRRDERELGEGVWRRAHDRFKRGLDRYHQILESVRDPELREAAVPVANDLADLLPRVRAVCTEAHLRAPSQTQDIPHSSSGYLSDVHRQLSRAGNAMAQTAEALTMAGCAAQGTQRSGAPDSAEGDRGPGAVSYTHLDVYKRQPFDRRSPHGRRIHEYWLTVRWPCRFRRRTTSC